MQYEILKEHLPCTQLLEQQLLPSEHELPEVLQLVFSGAHVPLLHLPPQHWLSAVQTPLSVTQAAAAHLLFSQRSPQQSVADAHASSVAAQLLNTDAQVLVFPSHTPEQQSLPPTHSSL